MNKRGLSSVITTVLLILIVLAAIGIIWGAVSVVFTGTGENVRADIFTTSYNIKSAGVVVNTLFGLELMRNVGKGDVVGVNVILTDDSGSSAVFPTGALVDELETQIFFVEFSGSGLSSVITKLEVAPIFSGGTKGPILDSFVVSGIVNPELCLYGNFDGEGDDVDFFDQLAMELGCTGPSCIGDLNGDEIVNIEDQTLFTYLISCDDP